jgi:hypothetical protein
LFPVFTFLFSFSFFSSLPALAFFFCILSNISFLHFILYYHLCVIVLSHIYIPPVLTSLYSPIHLPPIFCMNILPILHFVTTPSTIPPFYILHIKICNILLFNFWTCIMKYLLQNKCLKKLLFHMLCIPIRTYFLIFNHYDNCSKLVYLTLHWKYQRWSRWVENI